MPKLAYSRPLGMSCLLIGLFLVGCATPQITPCLRQFPPETLADRIERRELVATRRVGPVVLVHRGMWAAAPENTLQAYAAAGAFGADGIEVDIRSTADGVLVCFHDDGIVDRLLYGFGAVRNMTFAQLQQFTTRGNAAREAAHVPTLIAVLELARQRGLLLHLDIKQSGLDQQVGELLAAADLWPHVVYINRSTGGSLLTHSDYRPLGWKARAALYENRRDLDPADVQATLNRPGEMVIVDDPRLAAWILGRSAAGGREYFAPLGCPPLSDRPFEQSFPDPRAEAITTRAEEALAFELARHASVANVDRLRRFVAEPGLHPDYRYHALDAAAAVRALAAVGVTEAVDDLIAAFRRVSPELQALIAGQAGANYPPAWHEFRLREAILVALGDLPTPAGKAFLFEYLAMRPDQRRELGPPLLGRVTRALLKHELNAAELGRLLNSELSEVCGTAALTMVDYPTLERRAALERHASWALNLPSLNLRR